MGGPSWGLICFLGSGHWSMSEQTQVLCLEVFQYISRISILQRHESNQSAFPTSAFWSPGFSSCKGSSQKYDHTLSETAMEWWEVSGNVGHASLILFAQQRFYHTDKLCWPVLTVKVKSIQNASKPPKRRPCWRNPSRVPPWKLRRSARGKPPCCRSTAPMCGASTPRSRRTNASWRSAQHRQRPGWPSRSQGRSRCCQRSRWHDREAHQRSGAAGQQKVEGLAVDGVKNFPLVQVIPEPWARTNWRGW